MGYFDNLKTDELEHHGILGQKWGVRRFQNKDGALTEAGRKRYQSFGTKRLTNPDVVKSNGGKNQYNDDPWKLATSAGLKYKNLAELNAKKRAAGELLGKDPEAFKNSKERQEYIEAMVRTNRAFQYHSKLTQDLLKKYSDVSFDILTEEGTNEQYVQAILKSKTGETRVAEMYLGYHLYDKK